VNFSILAQINKKRYHMNKYTRIAIISIFSIIFAYSLWFFSGLLVYTIISLILSLIGMPLVKLLIKIEIFKWKVPVSLAAAITLLTEIGIVISIILVFIPIVSHQADVVDNIDNTRVSNGLLKAVQNMDKKLIDYGLIQADEPLEEIIDKKVDKIVNIATFSNLIKNLLSLTGNFFMGLFTICFMTFFFLRDENLFPNSILLLTPQRDVRKVRNILRKTKTLLGRYFVGLLIEISSMITLLIIGLTILGVPSAILIGFFGGTMNIIPYLGPIFGATLGTILGVIGELGAGNYQNFYLVGGKIGVVFLAANLVDNIVLQPLIYSNSVKAHPLEIFLVIMMAGTIGGAVGMIIAIPTYTMIRIVAGEFLGEFKLVQQLTNKIN
jgi:predicted PurR-regulated permease PerM